MEMELCIICEDPTGRAGQGDDSIYPHLIYPLWEMLELTTGEEVGPLCPDCANALKQLGFTD